MTNTTSKQIEMLTIQNLSCARGEQILFENLNFSVATGELLHVIGKNGSGKSTLLHCILGLIRPTNGAIFWNDLPIIETNYQSDLAYLGHKHGLKSSLTVHENLELIRCLASNNSMPVTEALARLELTTLQNMMVLQLSAGQKQRVALAKLLFLSAKLWILDEPFTAIDSEGAMTLRSMMEQHLANQGAILLTSHQELGLADLPIKILQLPQS